MVTKLRISIVIVGRKWSCESESYEQVGKRLSKMNYISSHKRIFKFEFQKQDGKKNLDSENG